MRDPRALPRLSRVSPHGRFPLKSFSSALAEPLSPQKTMNIDPLHEAPIIIHRTGIGTVSPDMVRKRAEELALINGREAHNVSKSDWDEATRELTCGDEIDPQQTLMESLPDSERWYPIPGSPSHEAVTVFDDNEDEYGRSLDEAWTRGPVRKVWQKLNTTKCSQLRQNRYRKEIKFLLRQPSPI